MTDRRCILVYNPVSGHGHLDSWNAIFIGQLLDRGWRVLALTPNVPALLLRLAQKGQDGNERLHILDWNVTLPRIESESRFRAFRRRASEMFHQNWRGWEEYCFQQSGNEISYTTYFSEFRKNKFHRIVIPFAFRASYFLYIRFRHLCQDIRSLIIRGLHWGKPIKEDPEKFMACPTDMARRVAANLIKVQWQPVIAFNMYMDTYRTSQSAWCVFESINSLMWGGIRFVPLPTPQEAWYALPTWRGMCFLDEKICHVYTDALPNKCFSYLPDVTETALPDTPSSLVQDIRQRAANRKIIFLGGSIGGQKNIARWFDLIAMADPQQWFFVQVGEIYRNTLTSEDIAALDRAVSLSPENLLLHSAYLPDDRSFNEIIAASDLIFAVYRNFRISSNMLGKAAYFRKPLLVSDQSLMGERVLQYGIGRAVAEDSAIAMFDGMVNLIQEPVPEENFARYCDDFCIMTLTTQLEKFLLKCLCTEVL
ncbi:Glycosyltransferase [Azospirillaceae bacterium]